MKNTKKHRRQNNNSLNKAHTREILIVVMVLVSLFFIGNVSALNFDNVKKNTDTTFDELTSKENPILEDYPAIKITNLLGLGNTLFEGYISEHDYTCGEDCKSVMQIRLNQEGSLIDDIIFKTKEGNNWKEQSVRKYNFYIYTKGQTKEVNNYKRVCEETGKILVNGSREYACEIILDGKRTEELQEWTPYYLGTIMQEGTYKIKLEAKKRPSRTVDWIIKTNGEWLNEWATWGNIAGGDDAQVNTTSPINKYIAPSRNINFQCTANITGSSLLTNISVFTNEDGNWDRRNTTTFAVGGTDESADATYVNHGTQTVLSGLKIRANKNVQFVTATKNSNSNVSTAYLYDSSNPTAGTKLASAVFVGDNATFDYSLVAGTIYYVVANGTTGAYLDYEDTGWSATNKTNIDFIAGWYGSDRVSEVHVIESLTTTQQLENTSNSWVREITNTTIWGCEACDNDSVCGFSENNRTILLVENPRDISSLAYETNNETYSINVSSNSSLTAVNLLFNGTSYAMTNVGGEVWNFTRDLPTSVLGNNSINFSYTFAGNTYYSNNQTHQYVNNTFFTICNSSYTNDFLNISFRDEADSSYINASIPYSTWTYYLGTGTINKTYTYTNATESFNWTFCASPTDKTFKVIPTFQYKQGTDYPQRIWNPSVQSFTSTVTNKILYLLGSADGIYVTFQVKNNAEQTLSGVDVIANTTLGGTDTTVGQGTTGDDGAITFWLNPDFVHTFKFSKTGFEDYTTSFAPTQTSYTITLGGVSSEDPSSFRGITYKIYPVNSSLINDTTYTFGMNLSSSYWDVTRYGFDLRLRNGTIITGSSTTTDGTLITKNYDTNNQSKIYIDYYWLINSSFTNITREWRVYNTDNTQWSIKNFVDDLKSYMDTEMFGLDNFGRLLIIFLAMFFSVGIVSYKFGFTSPLTVLTLIFLIIFSFDVVFGLIPDLSVGGGIVVPYLLTFISGLILTIFIVKESAQ